ncbi:MAG: zf-HC2 domain-containing protein [Candidatus Omnitrophica bacterium]|nr:zf-HC2 domain-containing protein [Candidatus Omnitrophota bacterium]
MPEKLEKFIGLLYKNWRSQNPRARESAHPDEETLACFLEGRLPRNDAEVVRAHLLNCDRCAEIFALSLKNQPQEIEVPEELLKRVKAMATPAQDTTLLEIILKLKDQFLEVINTTGDLLVGQELVPAPLLRSRSIKDFQDRITILKDFHDIRVEVKIENKAGKAFDLAITVRNRQTQKVIRDVRVTLIKDDLELESCLSDSGVVIFEHVLLGKYKIDISTVTQKLASVLLDIRT